MYTILLFHLLPKIKHDKYQRYVNTKKLEGIINYEEK